jgi:hypothetical protein
VLAGAMDDLAAEAGLSGWIPFPARRDEAWHSWSDRMGTGLAGMLFAPGVIVKRVAQFRCFTDWELYPQYGGGPRAEERNRLCI